MVGHLCASIAGDTRVSGAARPHCVRARYRVIGGGDAEPCSIPVSSNDREVVTVALPVRRREPATSRTPTRWEPFRELDELQRRTADLMENLWSGVRAGEDGPWVPSVDLEETDDAWIVEAEVPGVRREDVNVEVGDSELVISGDIKERERKGILRHRTRRTGRFEYRVTLPGHPDPEAVEASLADGVLTVRVPKPEEARPRRVDVQARA